MENARSATLSSGEEEEEEEDENSCNFDVTDSG